MTTGTDPADNCLDSVIGFHEQFHLADGYHIEGVCRITFFMDNVSFRYMPDTYVVEDGVRAAGS